MIKPSVFLFDMDGLLLDTEQVMQETFFDILAPHNIPMDAALQFFLGLVGNSGTQTRQKLLAFLPDDLPIERFEQEWQTKFGARMAENVPLKPHVTSALAALAEQGHRMAVVTSTRSAQAQHHLTRAGIIQHFEVITGGDMVSANKPDPAPYLETAAKLGAAPNECFAFEDSDPGITSAMRAGCDATQIPDLRPAGKPLPDLGQRVASDLWQALQQIGVLGAQPDQSGQ